MSFLIEFTKEEYFGLIVLGALLINLIITIILAINLKKTKSNYEKFMKKLGIAKQGAISKSC